jgi:DNA repair protein RadC
MVLPDEPPPLSLPSPPGPRERALDEGVAALGDAELLAVLLGTGLAGRPVALVAAGLLEGTGGLDRLARLGPAAIAEHPGVGPAKALRIVAALELGRRGARRAARSAVPVTSSATVAARLGPELAPLTHEEMWLVCLDGKNQVRATRRVGQGGLHTCAVMPRDVLRAALYEAATAMVLCHNHPSDDPLPSAEDLLMTRRLAEAGATVGVPLVDHVIVTPSGKYSSMLDLGVLAPA